MPVSVDRAALIRALEREPLRHIVLLKQLASFPDHTRAYRVTGEAGDATLVLLETAASAYDRDTYPGAAHAALIVSDGPTLTGRLLAFVPRDRGVVFKLATEADRDVVAGPFPLAERACFFSYTADRRYEPDPAVRVTRAPGAAALALFATQGHPQAWLGPMLAADRAFACVLEEDGQVASVCLGFENHGPVWEVGGVVTPAPFRGRGLAGLVVRTAVAELGARGLTARYQVESGNAASIAVAAKVGLRRFLTLRHYLSGAGGLPDGTAPFRRCVGGKIARAPATNP